MIVVQSDTHDNAFTLESRSGHGSEAECAAPNCTGPATEYTVTIGCDFEGTAADWGEIGFCSHECITELDSLGVLYTAPHEPRSLTLDWSETQLIRMTRDTIIDSTLTATKSNTPKAIHDLFTNTEHSQTPTDITITKNNTVLKQETITNTSTIQTTITTLLENTIYDSTDVTITIGEYDFLTSKYGH